MNDSSPEGPSDSPSAADVSRHEATIEVAAFLAREQGGAAAWDAFLAQHPNHAEELERQLASLQYHGLLGPAAQVPERVGSFRLLRRLGMGGMGVVYLGVHDEGTHAAIKLIRPDILLSASSRRRFEREVAAIRRLKHPGIVSFVGADTESDTPWMATEYLPGRSLAEALADMSAVPVGVRSASHLYGESAARESRTWDEAVALLLRETASALHHAHEHGITHRDIKPSNVRLLPDGRPVLIDFGLARFDAATTITKSGMLLGSLTYMAPELLSHGGESTPRSDVYALGVILYEALTGAVPFPGDTFDSIRSRVLEADPVPLLRLRPRLAPSLELVCRKAMDPDPAHRYASAEGLAVDLDRVIKGQPVSARPAPMRVRAARWLRRRPLRSVLLISGVILATIVPTVYALMQLSALKASYRLTDLHLVRELVEREALLWPLRPDIVPGPEGIVGWLATADQLAQRLPDHMAALQDLRRSGQRISLDEAAASSESARRLLFSMRGHEKNIALAISAKPAGWADWVEELGIHVDSDRRLLEEVHGWQFPDPEDAQEHRRLATLVVSLENLGRLRQGIERRADRIEELARTTQQVAEDWTACCAEISDEERSPVYRGLHMEPIFGTAPLGKDPMSGLFEFAHLPSGAPARRDPITGHLLTTEDTGIVLVLLPGGGVRVGADVGEGPHRDDMARDNETPSHTFSCDPFLVSKFELTHSQWQRFEYSRSLFKPGHVPAPGEGPVTHRHPVDGISKVDMQRVAGRMGLELPTSRQWECAARGGTTGAWWTGPDPEHILRAEVLFAEGSPPLFGPRAVGSRSPNPFGLHDVLGNVEEWCADSACAYETDKPAPGTGCSGNLDTGTVRGGSYRDRVVPRVSQRRDEPATSPLAGARLVLRLR